MEVDDLIKVLRETDEYIKAIFLNGGCWQFHKFLKVIFPDAVPYKVSMNQVGYYDHIVSKIGESYYDITGKVNLLKFCDCVPVQNSDIPILESWSFSKSNLLYKVCPYCNEEILLDTKGNIAAWG